MSIEQAFSAKGKRRRQIAGSIAGSGAPPLGASEKQKRKFWKLKQARDGAMDPKLKHRLFMEMTDLVEAVLRGKTTVPILFIAGLTYLLISSDST